MKRSIMKKKNLLTLLVVLVCSIGTSNGQITANSTIRISLDASQMQNVDCNLNGGTVANGRVYMHSGLCTNSQSFCDNQIVAYGGQGWEHIVGNWGMDDGIGLMSGQGNNLWTITFTVYDYYSNNISTGSTAMAQGATPYTIGLVFRNFDGTFEGKDILCNDIFLKDLQTTANAINSSDQTPNSAVSLDILTGLDDLEAVGEVVAYPNPSAEGVNLEYFLGKNMEDIQVRVINPMGQEIAKLFSGSQPAGTHRIHWDGAGAGTGVYFMIIESKGTQLSIEKVSLLR